MINNPIMHCVGGSGMDLSARWASLQMESDFDPEVDTSSFTSYYCLNMTTIYLGERPPWPRLGLKPSSTELEHDLPCL